jgi:hypothetical protein
VGYNQFDNLGDERLKLISVESFSKSMLRSSIFDWKDDIIIQVKLNTRKTESLKRIVLKVVTDNGLILFSISTEKRISLEENGTYVLNYNIPKYTLRSGEYYIILNAGIPGTEVIFSETTAIMFKVNTPLNNRGIYIDKLPGVITPNIGLSKSNFSNYSKS